MAIRLGKKIPKVSDSQLRWLKSTTLARAKGGLKPFI
jgi:hypothetical protein